VPDWNVKARRPRLAITFDDGWLDNYFSVVPVAAQLACPVTIFVCPGLTGVRFPFWPERVKYLVDKMSDLSLLYRGFSNLPPNSSRGQLAEVLITRLKYMSQEERAGQIKVLGAFCPMLEPTNYEQRTNQTMTWNQLQEISKSGIAIGSHTFSHCILTTVLRDQICEELTRSRYEIEAGLDKCCRMLAYPNGNCNTQVVELAKKAGYQLAFANEPGCWTRSTDRLRIPRTNIWEGKLTSPTGQFSRMMAEYHLFWSLPKGNRNQEELERQMHTAAHATADL